MSHDSLPPEATDSDTETAIKTFIQHLVRASMYVDIGYDFKMKRTDGPANQRLK